MQAKLNDKVFDLEPRRIMDVAELKRRMANGALLYWTMIRPAHAVLLDPEKNTVAQLAFFSKLWGLQRGKQIRHDRHDGIYQVFVPTSPVLEKHQAASKAALEADTLFAQSEPVSVGNAGCQTNDDSVQFLPSI